MGLREDCTDNGKHAPVGTSTKASASTTAFWRRSMGEWDSPGVQIVTDTDTDTTQDDSQQHNVPGALNYEPVSRPIGTE